MKIDTNFNRPKTGNSPPTTLDILNRKMDNAIDNLKVRKYSSSTPFVI